MTQSMVDTMSFEPAAPTPATSLPLEALDVWPELPQSRTVYENLGIRIDREGIWYYHGSPIRRKELLCLFAAAMRRDDRGGYWLITPQEMGPIEVEDAPFLAVELFVSGQGHAQRLSFRTNVDEVVALNADHPLRVVTDPETNEPAPYVVLPGRREARVSRAVFYELVALSEEKVDNDRTHLGVWSDGRFFSLGSVDG